MTQTVTPDPADTETSDHDTPTPRRTSLLGPSLAGYSLIGVWLLLGILYAILLPGTFLTHGVLRTIFGSQLPIVFLSASLLCTLLVGEFVDLSINSNFGLAATLLTILNVNHGWNVWLAALAAIVVAASVGAINGWLVVRLGVNTIVVTLGMGTFLLGIALWAAHLSPVSGLPASFANIALYDVLGLPLGFYLGLALMLGLAYVLRFTPMGRNMRFVGENREVSRLAGVRVNRMRWAAFTAAGVIVGVGGVLTAAGTGGFDPNASIAYQLPVFAATFLGTAILQIGRFNPLGAIVAVYFLETGVLGLQLLGASDWVSDVFYGGALVVAVTISHLLHSRTSSH